MTVKAGFANDFILAVPSGAKIDAQFVSQQPLLAPVPGPEDRHHEGDVDANPRRISRCWLENVRLPASSDAWSIP